MQIHGGTSRSYRLVESSILYLRQYDPYFGIEETFSADGMILYGFYNTHNHIVRPHIGRLV